VSRCVQELAAKLLTYFFVYVCESLCACVLSGMYNRVHACTNESVICTCISSQSADYFFNSVHFVDIEEESSSLCIILCKGNNLGFSI
jgi:hypothetical protein